MLSIIFGVALVIFNLIPAIYVGFSGWTLVGLFFAISLIGIGICEELEKRQ